MIILDTLANSLTYGERLYRKSQAIKEEKDRKINRIKEREKEEMRRTYVFKPTLNKKSMDLMNQVKFIKLEKLCI